MSTNRATTRAAPARRATVLRGVTMRPLHPGAAAPAVREAQARYGGIDVAGSLAGTFAALFLVLLVGGLIGAAVGTIGFQTGLSGNHPGLSVPALVGGSATLLVAFVVGGWAAARIARYDGVANGLMTGVWALLLVAVLATLGGVFGPGYDVFRTVPHEPTWFSRDALTVTGIASGAGSIVAMLLGGGIGGLLGERYHRRVDELIARTRPGGLSNQEQVVRL